jgi:hypothetical protein
VGHSAHHHRHHRCAHDRGEDEPDAGDAGRDEHDRDHEHRYAAGDHHPAVAAMGVAIMSAVLVVVVGLLAAAVI